MRVWVTRRLVGWLYILVLLSIAYPVRSCVEIYVNREQERHEKGNRKFQIEMKALTRTLMREEEK